MTQLRVPGVAVLYAFVPPYAATTIEHTRALSRHSRFPVAMINTTLGFPQGLSQLRFDAVVLHYSLFGTYPYELPASFREWLAGSDAYRVAFFQDEYRFWNERIAFVEEFRLDRLYTLVEPRFWDATYRRAAHVPELVHTLPGYVGEELRNAAARFARPDAERRIDVGYRARAVPFSLGRAGLEKTAIGREFGARAAASGLVLDIDVRGAGRLYGDDWWSFLGSCRALLGVEGGASAFDLDGSLLTVERRLLAREPDASFDRFAEEAGDVLVREDFRIPYLMITPRHFEAAAFACTQVLYEGRYSGILEPGRHYLPLRKDFSNLEDVLAALRDPSECASVAAAARRDLVDSHDYDYSRLVEDVDAALAGAGLVARSLSTAEENALRRLERGQAARALRRTVQGHLRRPGRATRGLVKQAFEWLPAS